MTIRYFSPNLGSQRWRVSVRMHNVISGPQRHLPVDVDDDSGDTSQMVWIEICHITIQIYFAVSIWKLLFKTKNLSNSSKLTNEGYEIKTEIEQNRGKSDPLKFDASIMYSRSKNVILLTNIILQLNGV